MKKSDLKTGSRCKLRNGDVVAVFLYCDLYNIEDLLVEVKGEYFMGLNLYTDDLKRKDDTEEFDIVEIAATSSSLDFIDFSTPFDTLPLIWKRPEVKEMTKEEIEKALGHLVKIVKEVENV